MKGHVKTAFSLPSTLVDDLAFISRRLGVAKSALVTIFLTEAVAELVRMLRDFDASGSSDAERLQRFRGESVPQILSRMEAVYKSARSDLESIGDEHGQH